MKMQIIIPMSGFGERFRAAGYVVPKPLILVDNRPIISYIIDLFPGESNFIFICNQDHLDNPDYRMKDILFKYCPTGQVVGISPHKLGPIHAILEVSHLIDDSAPVVVNYCDFTCDWSWVDFKIYVDKHKCDGCIPAYRGFHPHLLGTTNYAYLKVNDSLDLVLDIKEKESFTSDRMNEFASSGTYYFSSGLLMKKSCLEVISRNIHINGEYYVSMAYKPLLENGGRVNVYPIDHFMQWGTPEDLEEYIEWSNIFKRSLSQNVHQSQKVFGSTIIPMAGLGERFSKEGYELTKPLIPISGKPMVVQAANDLPKSHEYVFVIRSDMTGNQDLITQLKKTYLNLIIEKVDTVTDGQATTARIGLDALNRTKKNIDLVTIGACDSGVHYDSSIFEKLINESSVDVIVWGVRGHINAIRHPHMYGWIDADNGGKIKSVSVKKPLKTPKNDPIIIGLFTFKNQKHFYIAYDNLKKKNITVNGEYYIDSMVNELISLGIRCYLFEVDSFISWGTPNDLKTFEYWQSCFHKWNHHPYDSRLDPDVNLINQ